MTVSKIRLVFRSNKKRHVKRPVVFDRRLGSTPEGLVQEILKLASKKLCCKARGIYSNEGLPVTADNIHDFLNAASDGTALIITKKKGEVVPISPNSSPSLKPVAPPTLRRRASHEDHVREVIAPLFDTLLGASVIEIISGYTRNCPAFDSEHVPNTVMFAPGSSYATVARVAPSRKRWKEKQHKTTVLGYGVVQRTIHQITLRVDMAADTDKGSQRYLSIGVVDPRKFNQRHVTNYGIGDCSHSWGLGCDGMFRHRGKVIKLQDGQGRTPSWKTGDLVGININPVAGKLAFFVGRKQYRVNPRTVNLPTTLGFGVSLSAVGDQLTFLDWSEQDNMHFTMPKELRL
mmetsp:Transcript_32452/g.62646  ORF Transcript_32452/g.62646 Transcript_32452/m.62646 type:complete len:346 (+) Transcript_32452:278-1315(+)